MKSHLHFGETKDCCVIVSFETRISARAGHGIRELDNDKMDKLEELVKEDIRERIDGFLQNELAEGRDNPCKNK